MNICYRCDVKTYDGLVLRLGGAAGKDTWEARGIRSHYHSGLYNVTLCNPCHDLVLTVLQKCFQEGKV